MQEDCCIDLAGGKNHFASLAKKIKPELFYDEKKAQNDDLTTKFLYRRLSDLATSKEGQEFSVPEQIVSCLLLQRSCHHMLLKTESFSDKGETHGKGDFSYETI